MKKGVYYISLESNVSWNRLIEAQIKAVRCDTINVFLEMDIGRYLCVGRFFSRVL